MRKPHFILTSLFLHSSFVILHSSFFILHSYFFILHSLTRCAKQSSGRRCWRDARECSWPATQQWPAPPTPSHQPLGPKVSPQTTWCARRRSRQSPPEFRWQFLRLPATGL